MNTAFFTICSANYLAYALTLARSLFRTEGVKLHVFLVERSAVVELPEHEAVTVCIGDAGIQGLEEMAFRYTVLELNTAVKPYCFAYLFDQLGFDAAIYLDPDILILAPLEHVHAALQADAACVLTPHITQGLCDGGKPDENAYLTYGVFNLGFAAFANVPEARAFLAWWAGKTRRGCTVDLDHGIFTDQSYCNLAPCFIDRFVALRHPGYNVAYWNVPHRAVQQADGKWAVGGEPVRFFHFSGIDPKDSSSFSKHQTRYRRGDIGELAGLVDRYIEELTRCDQRGNSRYSDIPYSFRMFRDGTRISDLHRRVYRKYETDWPAGRSPFDLDPEFYNKRAADVLVFKGTTISRLYAALYDCKPDLQARFDIRTPAGQLDLQRWAVESLPGEYGIDDRFAVLPASGVTAEEWKRWQKDALLEQALTSGRFMARNFLRRQLLGKKRLQDYWQRRLAVSRRASTKAANSRGLDLYGFFRAESGIGQAARGFVKALKQTTIPYNCHTLVDSERANAVPFEACNGVAVHDTALICANADLLTRLDDLIEPSGLQSRRTIAHWAWELPVFPAAWATAFDKVDEVWVASRFIAAAVGAATTKPVRIVPYEVHATRIAKAEARARLKLPQDPYIFLFSFDISSYPARKNPLAVIRAFLDAFSGTRGESPLLILKYHGGPQMTDVRIALQAAIAGKPQIITIDAVYDPAEMGCLRAACDAFVSLHRSEGFGLNIAEAMAAGKLAIATGFSGNEDFMHRENSIPIPYRMAAVGAAEYPYGAGQWWAEPDHDAAVEAMRWAAANAADADALAARGMTEIQKQYAVDAVAKAMVDALAGAAIR